MVSAPLSSAFRLLARTLLPALALVSFLAVSALAQPSGGPYGPVDQVYTVPAGAPHVFHVAPDGRPDATGGDIAAPTTFETALSRATTGDVIVLRGGTYRIGDLRFNQGIVLQPHAGEHPVLKGTKVATEWTQQPNGLWRTKWTTLFPARPAEWWQRDRRGRETPPYRFNNDMVFIDGELLRAVGWEGEIDERSYFIDYTAGNVYIGRDPTNHLVEITAFDNALTRVIGEVNGRKSDGKGPIIRGITFTQYAYRALEIEGKNPEGLADPATFGKDVQGTTLEHVTITYCSRVAGYFRGDHLTIRNCLISDTRTEGVFVLSSGDVLLERNIFRRNNIQEITGYYPAAVKIFNQCYRTVCRDNLVIEQPHSNGIWYDVGNVDGVFVNNWIEGALDGFFFEISKGALCAGNVFVNCDKGIRVLNSSNVHAYHNTLLNTVASFERTERSAVNDHFGWHPSTGPDVDEREGHVFVGNLLVGDATFRKELLRFEQVPGLCGKLTRPQAERIDGNVYVRRLGAKAPTLIVWSPADGENCTAEYASLAAFQKAQASFESHGRQVDDAYGAVFRSAELRNFTPVQPFPSAAEVPAKVRELAGWPASGPLAAGAYQR